ncbi:efflux transporter outer membrane subunit [Undibacterium sp. 14-3-2]|uniref:efflux transporter outer membrane subunit n=1 Tax=Undibacterium sp. 14-3-2 TaxID=2800129 RepID=UPI00190322A9|nr:efflux transporter outer membrane subunit [Undibacterium sp. 14-3-2]MBK1889162.1 efflux transporter outer membrane subunit [Undibacterium sp. 14-3-2]
MSSISSPGFLPQIKLSRLLLALTLALGGCAQLPQSEPTLSMKTGADFPATNAFATTTSATSIWPDERWWQAYQDEQLNALIDEALRDAPDMSAAAARLARAEAFSQVKNAATKPQVNANASITEQKMSYNYLTPKSMTPNGWNDYGRATLDVSWELDFWGRNRAALAAATSQEQASRAEYAQARLTLAAAIASQYADLAQLFVLRDTLQRSVEIRQKTVQMFADRFAYGMETKGGLSEAKVRLISAEAELLANEEQIGLQRYRIAALLGAGPDRALAISRPTVNLQMPNGLPAELATNLLGRRPDIVAARLQAEASAHNIDQKKAEFYPNINLSAFIGVQSLDLNMLSKSGSSTGSIGPAISLPIFTAGRLQGELRSSTASYNEAVANYHRAISQALQEVASAGLSQQALSAQLMKSKQGVAAATDAYSVAKNRYQGGLATYLEVLSAEDSLLINLRALTTLEARAFTLDVAMKRALGGGYQSTANT